MSFNPAAVVVIPTRNRADLVRNAIRSVLNQPNCEVDVLVSDNSNEPAASESLVDFCRELADQRLRYVRPPRPLPMTEHWDWALSRALESEATHFAFLSDRMMFKPAHLQPVIDIVAEYPQKILCYLHDKVADFAPPYIVYQYDWTGRLYEVESTRLLTLSAQSVIYDMCFPRMLNCFVPRPILDAIKDRFGNIFTSIAPDWSFGYRALEMVDSLLYLNKSVLVHYAIARSNGESAERGIDNQTYLEFVSELPKPVNFDAPFPEIITVWNAVISEYCYAKKESHSSKFPELDMDKYMEALATGIEYIQDPARKKEMRERLLARGWKPQADRARRIPPDSFARKLLSPRLVGRKLKSILGQSDPPVFKTADEALEFALNHTRPRAKAVPWDESVHQGVDVPRQTAANTDRVH